jgi:hypothetical protein
MEFTFLDALQWVAIITSFVYFFVHNRKPEIRYEICGEDAKDSMNKYAEDIVHRLLRSEVRRAEVGKKSILGSQYAPQERAAYQIIADVLREQYQEYFDDEEFIEEVIKNQVKWIVYKNGKEGEINDKIIKAVYEHAGEEFIDQVVARINRKQIK